MSKLTLLTLPHVDRVPEIGIAEGLNSLKDCEIGMRLSGVTAVICHSWIIHWTNLVLQRHNDLQSVSLLLQAVEIATELLPNEYEDYGKMWKGFQDLLEIRRRVLNRDMSDCNNLVKHYVSKHMTLNQSELAALTGLPPNSVEYYLGILESQKVVTRCLLPTGDSAVLYIEDLEKVILDHKSRQDSNQFAEAVKRDYLEGLRILNTYRL